MTKPSLLTLAFTALLITAGFSIWPVAAPALAAEAPTDSEEAERDPDEEEAASAPSSEVFIPTEEISEDFAVSFPVDI